MYAYSIVTLLAWDSLSLADCYIHVACGEREYRGTAIGIKLSPGYTCDVGVPLHSKTYPLFM